MPPKKVKIDHSTIPAVKQRLARELAKKIEIWQKPKQNKPSYTGNLRSMLAKLKYNQQLKDKAKSSSA